MAKPRSWSDEELEPVIGYVLRAGVAAAALLVLVGGAEYLARYASSVSDYRVFAPDMHSRGIAAVLRDPFGFGGRDVIMLGLLLLFATPLLRVALYLVSFVLQRDALYAAVTALVLAVLLYSILGHGIG